MDRRPASRQRPDPSLPQRFEGPAQLVPGAVDVGLHGTQRQVERRRDFFVRPAFHMTQHDASAILGTQPADGPFDGRPQFPGLDLLEGILLVGFDLNSIASTSEAEDACGLPSMLIVSTRRRRR